MNIISFQDVYQTITQRGQFKLGQRAVTPDGREWSFVTATTMLNGSLAVPAAVTTTTLNSSAVDAQGRIVFINRAASTMTVGAFEDAIGVISSGTGTGQTFKVRTNTATQVQLYPETALSVALAVADSQLSLINMASVARSAITSKIQQCIGGAQTAFTSGDFGWILTNGDGRVISSSVLTVGANFTTGGATVGQALLGITAEGPFNAQNLGFAIVANSGVDTSALVRYSVR